MHPCQSQPSIAQTVEPLFNPSKVLCLLLGNISNVFFLRDRRHDSSFMTGPAIQRSSALVWLDLDPSPPLDRLAGMAVLMFGAMTAESVQAELLLQHYYTMKDIDNFWP